MVGAPDREDERKLDPNLIFNLWEELEQDEDAYHEREEREAFLNTKARGEGLPVESTTESL